MTDTAPIGGASSAPALMSGPDFYPGALTGDALLTYISARLQGIDGRIDEIFERQKRADQVRSVMRSITTELQKLDERPDNPTARLSSEDVDEQAVKAAIDAQLAALDDIDPGLAKELRAQLYSEPDGVLFQIQGPPSVTQSPGADLDKAVEDGHQVTVPNGAVANPVVIPPEPDSYTGNSVKVAKEVVQNVQKRLDAAAQLEMIHLQTLTAARQTALSLATNILATLGDSSKGTADNIGR